MPILIATKEKYMILSSKEDEGGKKKCHKETGQNRNRITTTNKERHFHDMYFRLPCFQSHFLILSHFIRESPLMKRHFLKNKFSLLQQLRFKYCVESILDDFDDLFHFRRSLTLTNYSWLKRFISVFLQKKRRRPLFLIVNIPADFSFYLLSLLG